MKKIAVTAINQKAWNGFKRWLLSLRRTGFDGDIGVMYYQNHKGEFWEPHLKAIKRVGFRLLRCDQPYLSFNRFERMARWEILRGYNAILFSDGGDVWFQGSLDFYFQYAREHKQFLYAYEGFDHWEESCNRGWAERVDVVVRDYVLAAPVVNCGVIIAPLPEFLVYSYLVGIVGRHLDMDQIAVGVLNTVFPMKSFPTFCLTVYNPLDQQKYMFKEGKVLHPSGEPYAVIHHNAGRALREDGSRDGKPYKPEALKKLDKEVLDWGDEIRVR